ncbi:hypothetical protein [Terrisporobacter sp.]|uniref:hypothetical protein n=1 Tax=Terrisporobacter sp. TaxID=1965305 RepID=UPI00262F0B36|nr:hypothetical protein [Terrisporobacter sp.]
MKTLIENSFWMIVIVFGSMYLIFLEIRNYNNNKRLKSQIKYTEESIVDMKIINKRFSKGTIMRISGAILPSVLPSTYTIELEYKGNNYEINDQEIFTSYEIGEFIRLKLIESLDKDKNIIKYDLFKLS